MIYLEGMKMMMTQLRIKRRIKEMQKIQKYKLSIML
jgi:hypothetical protein